MGYKLKTHSGAAKRFKKTGSSVKSKSANRNHILTKQSNIKSLQYAFRDRKNRKRAFRSLWIARINAGARELGVPYSKLINGLAQKDIAIDRRILSDLAINDSSTFEKIVQTAVK